ncbi:MAG: methionine--tRNA ligase [Gammaproteobacteria bacterium]|nr:methionine--tRNA ligase [Gammaproteobacteria bacterium]
MNPAQQRRILVTSALPYANGPIHLGHLVEYIQTDIWVRFQRMRGHEVYYVCADDAHGTPIMLRADAEGISPQALIERVGVEHQRDFASFGVSFDNYYTTHCEENRVLSEYIYSQVRDKGHTRTGKVAQAYDAVKGMFLPDRYVKGTCPICKTPDQYGDACENCSGTYAPTDLIDPLSVVSGTPPEIRESTNIFVKLGDFEPMLRAWVRDGGGARVQPAIANKLDEWFKAGLQDWDISRDEPYFGFAIPDAPGKYFYVWVDAPIGYMASFRNLCDRTAGLEFDDFWAVSSTAEVYHFIGKDIAYFHTLFWPALLHGAGFRMPTAVNCHGFLTVDGTKMSKSRGTFIMAATYKEYLEPEYLRYYFAYKLGNGIDDLDLNLDDFAARVNSDLVGKLVNIAARCDRFISRAFDGRLADSLPQPELYQAFVDAGEEIAALYEGREFAKVCRRVMQLADRANQYIDEHKPWVMAKDAEQAAQVQPVCTLGLNLFRVLMVYLKPVLPALAERVEQFFASGALIWNSAHTPLLGCRINRFERLLNRIDKKAVAAMVQASKEPEQPAPAAAEPVADEPVAAELGTAEPAPQWEPLQPTIGYDTFAKVDLRVAQVMAAHRVEGADKLLSLKLDLGFEERTVLAGIKSAYDPATLSGRKVVVVANLAARKMRFGTSEGMVLAAGPGEADIWLLDIDDGAVPGLRIR